MRYLSLFSGIEAASVAWEPLGWKPVGFSEIEEFPCAVLKHHWPDVPNLGDVTKITAEDLEKLGPFDLIVGGSPCQDWSIAGKRSGMWNEDGSLTRSGLFEHQIRIFELARKINGCRWLLHENVPGMLSQSDGDEFAYVLGAMVKGEISAPADGWGNSGICVSPTGDRIVEWRILDAQYFRTTPQRRRRVFTLLDTGAWWRRFPVLFERKGLSWNPVTGEPPREGLAGSSYDGSDPNSGGWFDDIIRTSIPKGDEDDE